ncbi:MAG: response regulator, partial [Acidobacteria bacterium]|nr:response regulator [Acidobacteriota bacterium]
LASGEISIVYEDVTEHRRTEEAFQEAQRLDAVGKLAGGIAHEFNNTLQTLLAAIEILRLRPEDQSPEDLHRTIEARIRHGSALVRQLLLLGRRSVAKPERVDLGSIVFESCTLLRRVIRENIELTFRTEREGVVVLADRGQLDQILVNLVTNASDALPGGGRIDVNVGARAGFAEITVADNGPGIPSDIRDRVFEPFFSTKPRNEGAGLGLAVVRGLVDAYEGHIELDTELGRGATFRIRIPLAVAIDEPVAHTEPAASDTLPQGQGTRLLLIEDEDGPRETLHEMLALLGYEVCAVASAEEALALPDLRPFDLLLTDFMLPGRSGRQIASELRERWPGLRSVVMSGYAEDESIREDVSRGSLRFLHKPFSMSDLARELKTLADLEPEDAGRVPETVEG